MTHIHKVPPSVGSHGYYSWLSHGYSKIRPYTPLIAVAMAGLMPETSIASETFYPELLSSLNWALGLLSLIFVIPENLINTSHKLTKQTNQSVPSLVMNLAGAGIPIFILGNWFIKNSPKLRTGEMSKVAVLDILNAQIGSLSALNPLSSGLWWLRTKLTSEGAKALVASRLKRVDGLEMRRTQNAQANRFGNFLRFTLPTFRVPN